MCCFYGDYRSQMFEPEVIIYYDRNLQRICVKICVKRLKQGHTRRLKLTPEYQLYIKDILR